MNDATRNDRRQFMAGLGGAGALALCNGVLRASPLDRAPVEADASTTATSPVYPALPVPPAGGTAHALARDESWWARVRSFYDRADGITDLEHGYWGRMARPVLDSYLDNTVRVNREGAWYARRAYAADHAEAVRRVARALGAHEDEIVLTRNATEAIHNLVRQYRHLDAGDAVLYADADYPAFKRLMQGLASTRGVEAVRLTLPARADGDEILARYRAAFDAHRNLRLALVTHASNQHGLVLPVAEIAAEARARGIDVVCDAAQSWGLVDFRIGDLGVDWAGFNLHKWIGAPLGLGALYMRRGSLARIAPYPGETDPDGDRAATRIHTGTANFAAAMTVPAALDFHETIGGANKEARLRYLRSLWTGPLDEMAHVQVLGGTEEASWSGIGAFRLAGRTRDEDARALQRRLQETFGVFTVVRSGLDSGACVRVTPQVFTTPAEIARLVEAVAALA